MGKSVVIQIGTFRLRDGNRLLPCEPLFKTVSPIVAEALAERIAMLLADCYNDYEKLKGGGENDKENI